MKRFGKGFALYFLYESRYLGYKLLLLLVASFGVQAYLAQRFLDDLSYAYDETVRYLSLSTVYTETFLPYLFWGSLVLSFGLICYSFLKNRTGGNKLNTLCTLPYPKLARFLAHYLWAMLCPLAVCGNQFLLNVILVQYRTETLAFRNNELLLSGCSDGFLRTFFPPHLGILVNLGLIIVIVTLLFVGFQVRDHAINPTKMLPIALIMTICLGRLLWMYARNPSPTLALILFGGLLVYAIALLILCYRRL